jgi:hypothetical protein
MAITDIKLSGKLFADAGTAVNGATVALLETGTSTEETSTTTNSSGEWSFTETSLNTTYDVKISVGSSVRYILWSDEITVTGLDTASLKVRGVEGAAAPIYFFADQADDAGDAWRIQASASDTLAIGSDKASAGTIIDYLTITNGATAAASLTTILGKLTVGVDDAGADVTFYGDTASRYWLWDTSADGVVQRGTLTVGVDDTGHDVKLFGATAGSYWLWDESADGVVQIGTLTVGVDDAGHDVKFFGDTASAYMLWDTSADDLVLAGAAGIDLAGNIDVDGTANLDVVDIDGAVQIDATFTSGVDGQGYDTKFFGDTSGAYILWDTSADKLLTAGGAVIDIVKDKLLIGGTAVTTTAAELNLLDTASANSVVNSKAVIYGGSGELAGTLSTAAQGSVTSLGTLTALTVDSIALNGATIGHTSDTDLLTLASGIVTVAGEVSMTTLDMGGTNVTSTAAELNILDGVTSTAAELNILDGVTSTAAELNILDGVTSTAAELNIVDGVTSTAAELNLVDGSSANSVVNSKAVIYGSSGELAGTLSTAAQTNITSLGTQASALNMGSQSVTAIGNSGSQLVADEWIQVGANTQQHIVSTTGTSTATLLSLRVAASSTGDYGTLETEWLQGSGTGSANNMGYVLGYNSNQAFFYLRSRDTNAGGSADTDIWRIADGSDDIRFLGGISVGADSAPASGIVTDGTVFVGDTANGEMTTGLTINQGAADDLILALKSSDVNTGLTTGTLLHDVEVDDFFTLNKLHPDQGGVSMQVLAKSGRDNAFVIDVLSGAPPTTDTSASTGTIGFFGAKHDGSNALQDFAANSNLIAWGEINSSSARLTRMLLKADDGELHLGNTTIGDLGADSEDDILALRAMRRATAAGGFVDSKWEEDNPYHDYERLRELELVGIKDSEGFFLFPLQKRLAFHEDTMWQIYIRLMDTTERIDTLETKLLAIEGGK